MNDNHLFSNHEELVTLIQSISIYILNIGTAFSIEKYAHDDYEKLEKRNNGRFRTCQIKKASESFERKKITCN